MSWSERVSAEPPSTPVRDGYGEWRQYSEEMDAHWTTRRQLAERALLVLPEDDTIARRFAVGYGALADQERLWCRRFQLLMLLRHRAMGSLE